jgi:hypothetical protein
VRTDPHIANASTMTSQKGNVIHSPQAPLYTSHDRGALVSGHFHGHTGRTCHPSHLNDPAFRPLASSIGLRVVVTKAAGGQVFVPGSVSGYRWRDRAGDVPGIHDRSRSKQLDRPGMSEVGAMVGLWATTKQGSGTARSR